MLKIKTMKNIKGDHIIKLDRSSLSSVLSTFFSGKHNETITFDKEWISDFPYGRTTISIPGSINELRISRDLVGKPLREEVYLNIVEDSNGYILKVGPARFESSKKQGYSLAEFLQKWQELQPDKYNTWKGGVEMEEKYQKIIEQYGNEYADYWYDLSVDGRIDPMSYDEWLENEQYAQDCIDQSRLTEAERYGL